MRAARRTRHEPSRGARTASFEAEALPELDALRARALRLTGGDGPRAADLVQETMIRAYGAWDGYERGTNVGAWLMTILRNVFVSDYRRRMRTPRPIELDERAVSVLHLVSGSDPEDEFFRRVIDREVVRAISELPDEFRLPLLLSDLEELDYAEIAARLGVPLGTVKSRLHRARRRLRRRLRDHADRVGYPSVSARDAPGRPVVGPA